MKVKELYNMCLKAVSEGCEDFDIVISEVSILPNTEDIENLGENLTVVLDTKEFRIFESKHSDDELDAYERMCINDID